MRWIPATPGSAASTSTSTCLTMTICFGEADAKAAVQVQYSINCDSSTPSQARRHVSVLSALRTNIHTGASLSENLVHPTHAPPRLIGPVRC